jgi:hypothetical protein
MRRLLKKLWWHQGQSDFQPLNGWESYFEKSLTHDSVGL